MKWSARSRIHRISMLVCILAAGATTSCLLYQPIEPSLLWHDFEATAYCDYGFTASGVWVRDGIVAADPRILPLGSVIDLKVGDAVRSNQEVMDTGGKIKGYIVDVWLPTCEEAVAFGRQHVKVRVKKLGDINR